MTDRDFRYLTQDFSWNSIDSRFILPLHSDVFFPDSVPESFSDVKYEHDGDAEIAIFQDPQISALIYVKSKQGSPLQDVKVRFENGSRLSVHWPGVTRIFARVRILESTDPDNMIVMLRDDIEGGYSMSDVETPEENQSRRPWSDEEDSETNTLDEEDSER